MVLEPAASWPCGTTEALIVATRLVSVATTSTPASSLRVGACLEAARYQQLGRATSYQSAPWERASAARPDTSRLSTTTVSALRTSSYSTLSAARCKMGALARLAAPSPGLPTAPGAITPIAGRVLGNHGASPARRARLTTRARASLAATMCANARHAHGQVPADSRCTPAQTAGRVMRGGFCRSATTAKSHLGHHGMVGVQRSTLSL